MGWGCSPHTSTCSWQWVCQAFTSTVLSSRNALGSCWSIILEVTVLWLVSESTRSGPGSVQTKKEASGHRVKVLQPGSCSHSVEPSSWLMLDVWTWAMQLASCYLHQLSWKIESCLDLPEPRYDVWSDLSRINKYKAQHISVRLC